MLEGLLVIGSFMAIALITLSKNLTTTTKLLEGAEQQQKMLEALVEKSSELALSRMKQLAGPGPSGPNSPSSDPYRSMRIEAKRTEPERILEELKYLDEHLALMPLVDVVPAIRNLARRARALEPGVDNERGAMVLEEALDANEAELRGSVSYDKG